MASKKKLNLSIIFVPPQVKCVFSPPASFIFSVYLIFYSFNLICLRMGVLWVFICGFWVFIMFGVPYASWTYYFKSHIKFPVSIVSIISSVPFSLLILELSSHVYYTFWCCPTGLRYTVPFGGGGWDVYFLFPLAFQFWQFLLTQVQIHRDSFCVHSPNEPTKCILHFW